MTRGFVTLAVGKDSYYHLANNLLRSYRETNNSCTYMPWTIVCDRENKWTADFDSIVLLDHPSLSYMDKLKVFSLCPYDECIFIDADCLVFKDISPLWEHMNDVDGFSCFEMLYHSIHRTDGSCWKMRGGGRIRFRLFLKCMVAFATSSEEKS